VLIAELDLFFGWYIIYIVSALIAEQGNKSSDDIKKRIAKDRMDHCHILVSYKY